MAHHPNRSLSSRWVALTLGVAFAAACSEGGSSTNGPNGGAGSSGSNGPSGGSGASGSGSGGRLLPDGGFVEDPKARPIQGGPGCGLPSAAFCDVFEAPSNGGRAGELFEGLWSVSRLTPSLNDDKLLAVGEATLRTTNKGQRLPECRSGLADKHFPPGDTRICVGAGSISSGHLLIAAAAQNYGANSYRIRQPFDFSDRTGTIVFDADVYTPNSLLGWLSLELTDEPIPTPGFAQLANFEGTPVPRNGFGLHFFQKGCARVSLFTQFKEHIETDQEHFGTNPCPLAAWGKLNHFEVKVSKTTLEVFASEASNDGTTFGALTKVFSSPIDLAFSRGYVHLTMHNHATKKYWESFGDGFTDVDAWVARVDNVGFDGPVLKGSREVSAPLPAAPPQNGQVAIGHRLADRSKGGFASIAIGAVNRSGMARARIALNAWYCIPCGGDPAAFVLHYRLNGGAWHDRRLSAGERAAVVKGGGATSLMLDVPMTELVDPPGSNVVELATSGVPESYPPTAANLDLVLDDGT